MLRKTRKQDVWVGPDPRTLWLVSEGSCQRTGSNDADSVWLIPESRRAPLLCRPEVILSLASGKMISACMLGRGKMDTGAFAEDM